MKQSEVKESVRKQIEELLRPEQVASVEDKLAFLQAGEVWLNDAAAFRDAIGVTSPQAKGIEHGLGHVPRTWHAQGEKDIDKAIQVFDVRQKQAVRAEVMKLYRSLHEDTLHYATKPDAATYVSRFHLQIWLDPISNPRPSSFFLPEFELLCWPGNCRKLEVTDDQMSKLLEISARYAAAEKEFATEHDNAKRRARRDKAVTQVRRDVESVLPPKQLASLDEMILPRQCFVRADICGGPNRIRNDGPPNRSGGRNPS